MSYWDSIILTILTIGTVRDVTALIGIFPRNKKWSWIIYNIKDDEVLLENSLRRLGFTKDEATKVVSNSRLKKVVEPEIKLLSLISKYIYNNEYTINYGVNTKVSSNYYINTMEAVHDKNDLRIMCDLISNLILNDEKEKRFPHFIITPKIGNPVLGKRFAENNNILSILRKTEEDKSRARVDSNFPQNILNINFEGSNRVIKKSKEEKNKLYGVLIDCNASGGSEILKTIEEFNELIDQLNLNIEKIKKAFILFKVDDKSNLQKSFSDKGFTIKYYFELNEDLKMKIFESKGDNEKLDQYKNDDFKKLKQINCSLCKNKT